MRVAHNSLAESDLDWDFNEVELEAVESVVRVVCNGGDVLEEEDLRQDLLLWLAARPTARAKWGAGHPGTLWRNLNREALNVLEREQAERGLHVPVYDEGRLAKAAVGWSIDEVSEWEAPPGMSPYTPSSTPAGNYTRDMVEEGLYALWDDDCGFGETNPLSPPPDMPRGPGGDPSHSGGMMAVRADASVAWDGADLSDAERRRVWLTYGPLYMHPKDVGETEGVNRTNVIRSVEKAIGKMVAFLNGTEWEEIENG